jgi:hypothetical protein
MNRSPTALTDPGVECAFGNILAGLGAATSPILAIYPHFLMEVFFGQGGRIPKKCSAISRMCVVTRGVLPHSCGL